MLARFFVGSKNGKPAIPDTIPVLSVEPRGNGFEVLVDEKGAKYLRKRRYAIEVALPKDHLSVSQVNTYLRCPLQYYYRYVKGITLPPDSALTYGKVGHKVLEANYRQKIETHEDLPLETMKDMWSDEFDKVKDETEWEEGEKPGQVKDEGIAMLEVVRENLTSKVQPVLVEVEEDLPLENVEFSLKARIDVVDQSFRIRDSKFSKRSPQLGKAQKSLQLATYSAVFRAQYGFEESGISLDTIVRSSIAKIVTDDAPPPSDDMVRRAMKRYAYVARAIRDGLFYPCHEDTYVCDPRYCGYSRRNLCERW